MKMLKLNHDFLRLSNAELETRTTSIIAALIGNANFANPMPPLADVSIALKNFADALAASQSRDKVKIAIRIDMRKALLAALVSLANYVNFTANSDNAILVSSGFTVAAGRLGTSALGTVKNFSVEMGPHSGDVTMSISAVTSAKAYLFLYRDSSAAGNAWIPLLSSYSSITLAGLDALKSYSFRIGVCGAKDQAAYTDIITKTVV